MKANWSDEQRRDIYALVQQTAAELRLTPESARLRGNAFELLQDRVFDHVLTRPDLKTVAHSLIGKACMDYFGIVSVT